MQINEQITWTSPSGNREVIVKRAAADVFQVIDRLTGTAGNTPRPYGTEAEARYEARQIAVAVKFAESF